LYITLNEGYELRTFEITVLRKMIGPKQEEVTGWQNKLYEEHHDMYASPNIISVMKSRRE
jgi:hypothetical protein